MQVFPIYSAFRTLGFDQEPESPTTSDPIIVRIQPCFDNLLETDACPTVCL